MSVAAHLRIRLDEYDARIRTFIPGYEPMLNAAAAALRGLAAPSPRVLDLGTGTGALATATLQVRPDLQLTLIDEDPDILAMAQARLSPAVSPPSVMRGSFLTLDLPPCNAAVASLALHHIHDPAHKLSFYRTLHSAIAPGGLLVNADCCPSADPRLAAAEHATWRAHLLSSYSADETEGYFAAWAQEDRYFSLEDELEMLGLAGFSPQVIWRQAPFAVIAAHRG